MLYAIIAQASTATTETVKKVIESDIVQQGALSAEHSALWRHMLNADPVVKLTLLVLIFFSVMCWAVIFFKLTQLKAAQKTAQRFWHRFSATSDMSEVAGTRGILRGPIYEIFTSGHQTISKIKKSTSKLTDFHRNIILQNMNQSREEELYKLEQYVSFLATTASVAPFIGLFGTVWGILTAFMAIGKAGSSSLATVGPYISEALVATAVGLFAAIPAVIAYNYFVSKIKIINKLIDLFMNDFIIKSEREISA